MVGVVWVSLVVLCWICGVLSGGWGWVFCEVVGCVVLISVCWLRKVLLMKFDVGVLYVWVNFMMYWVCVVDVVR